MAHKPINYLALNEALLQRVAALLRAWLPNGEERNGRWYIGDFDGSAGESANVNMDTGQWIDNGNADDVGRDLISLYARLNNLSNHDAAVALMRDELGWERPGTDVPVQASARASHGQGEQRPEPTADGEEMLLRAPAQDKGEKKPRQKRWQAVVPVPDHAPAPKFRWLYYDKKRDQRVELEAVKTWEYSFEGQRYGYVARFERTNSEGELVKDTLPLTWCESLDDGMGHRRWHWKQWEAPRPLFVPSTLLSRDLSLPVVVVEGEKCAEAGHQLLGHEFDFVTWPGGCKAWALANWFWLVGRTVYLWPDCDAQREALNRAEREQGVEAATKPIRDAARQPGMQAMVGIGTELQAKHGCKVFICKIPAPGSVPDGWDIADAIASGWDAARVREFIRAAGEFRSPNDEARAMAAETPSGAGASDEEAAIAWRRKLILSSTGAIKACRENIVLALDGIPEQGLPGAAEVAGVIAFNEFTNNVVKLKAPPWGTGEGVWQEEDELEMGNWLSRTLYLPPMPRGTLEEAVLMVAKRHKFHPVREEITSLRGKWDRKKRLSTWLRRVCMAEAEYDDKDPLQQYLARAGTWFVMAMCARVLPEVKNGVTVVRGPGTKFDYMLVFEGKQGWGKSTIAAILGGDYFADTGLILGEKDSYQNLQGIHVYEWGELDSLAKAEVTKVKQFIASCKDRFRASFDKRPRDYPRQVVFVGTTNESHYLTDLTGNRRFWPVRLEQPADLTWLRENREQLLAEALHYLDRDVRFFPTAAEQREMFDPQQMARTVESSIDSQIRTYLYDEEQKVPHNGVNGATVNQISLVELLGRIGYTPDKQTAVVMKQAGSVMERLGWTVIRPKANEEGQRPRFYRRPAGTVSAAAIPSNSSTQSTQPTVDDYGFPL